LDPGPSWLADADSDLADSVFLVLGVPFDGTATFRRGAREGPAAIREASQNFDPWLMELGMDMGTVAVHDAGDVDVKDHSVEVVHQVEMGVSELMGAYRIPVLLGGEHNATEGAVRALHGRHEDLRVLVLDAHLDYLDEYMGDFRSHACATRRCTEVVGAGNVAVLGIRSASRDELVSAGKEGLAFATADGIEELGLGTVLLELLDSLGDGPLYLSIDLDVLDPSHAPGVQNPEPWGMSPLEVRHVIDRVASRVVGMDVMECAPGYDGGQTAMVAARLVRHAIGSVWKERERNPVLTSIHP
jgi:agmatinase